MYTDQMAMHTVQHPAEPHVRSELMSLMNEALARAHSQALRKRAAEERRALRLLAVRRMERRAARAERRAQRLANEAAALALRSY
jgi:hypothetical protein